MISLLLLLLPVASSLTLCALAKNSTTNLYELDTLNFKTGVLTPWLLLPNLENYGEGPSAGAQYGSYYTVVNDIARESDYFIAELRGNSSRYVRLIMPEQFKNLTRYGIASLNVDESSQSAIALIVGIDAESEWYCFLGLLNDKTGEIVKVVADLTDQKRTWVYLYNGITAWDSRTGMYYLQAVVGEHDYTTLFAFNTTISGPQVPAWHLTYPYSREGEGMFFSLAISPVLESKGLGSLVAMVDDEDNSAAAIWVTKGPQKYVPFPSYPRVKGIPFGSRAPRRKRKNLPAARSRAAPKPWTEIIQFPRDKLSGMGGDNNMILDNEGNAYAFFYDAHRPVANQVVLQVDLLAGQEASRSIIQGSQRGTDITFLVQCPFS